MGISPEARAIGQIFVEERSALLDVGLGRFTEAAECLERARPLIARAVEAQLIAPLAEAAAELACWEGRPLDARMEVQQALGRVDVDQPAYVSRLGPLYALGLCAEADLSSVARARRDDAALATSEAVARRHLTEIGRMHAVARSHLPNFAGQADAWFALCVAEETRRSGRTETAAWAAAAAALGGADLAYPRAYALYRQAESALSESRRRVAAVALLREAAGIAGELGAAPLRDAISVLATRSGLVLSQAGAPSIVATAAGPFELTRRELEVLRQIASGRSNRQIAEALFITEGTAGTHVSNILSKLDVRGRTEAASLAHRLGLVNPD